MKNITIQTIRVAVVSLFAFFVLAGDAFAAPILAPVAVTNITGESATLEDYVTNQGRNSIVWFEWSEGASTAAPNIVARQGLYGEGTFTWILRDLTPGVVYSYRAAAMDGGVITYGPIGSFRTPVKNNSASAQVVYQGGQTNGALGVVPYNQTTSPSSAVTQTQAQTPTSAYTSSNTNTTIVVEKKNIVATTTAVKTDGFTNGNSAAVGSVGGGVLPSTLIGWVLLLIAILIMVLIAVMIYEASEKRRVAREEKKKIEEEDVEKVEE